MGRSLCLLVSLLSPRGCENNGIRNIASALPLSYLSLLFRPPIIRLAGGNSTSASHNEKAPPGEERSGTAHKHVCIMPNIKNFISRVSKSRQADTKARQQGVCIPSDPHRHPFPGARHGAVHPEPCNASVGERVEPQVGVPATSRRY